MSSDQFKWERVEPGAYRCEAAWSIGIIEKSVRGWWWWTVIAETGEDQGGRRLTLKEAKKAANAVLNQKGLRRIWELL